MRGRADGWAAARTCRTRHFDEQEALLVRDVQALHAPCGLLGDDAANNDFAVFAPLIAARLLATGGAVATRG